MLQSKQSLSPQGLNNLKKYVCSFCTKKFLSKSALKAHTKFIHQHINIFECPYENCDKYFNTQYRLDIHKLIHKGIKPYKCDLCEKTFTEQGTLRTHLVTHSMIKPPQMLRMTPPSSIPTAKAISAALKEYTLSSLRKH